MSSTLYIRVTGRGTRESLARYLYDSATLHYAYEDDGEILAVVEVTHTVQVRPDADFARVFGAMGERLRAHTEHQASRLSSGNYGAKITEEPEVD